jgi:hypothetical protein
MIPKSHMRIGIGRSLARGVCPFKKRPKLIRG